LKQITASVSSNTKILDEFRRPHARTKSGTWIIWLHCPEIAAEAKPGQFVMVRCGKECTLLRPFSIHQVNGKGDIALFYAVLARVT
jgi:NAD(P)H-flavin reductase